MPKPFTMHSPQDYVLTTGDKVSGFFHLTQRVITQLLHQGDGGHVVTLTPTRAKHAYVNIPSALADHRRRSDRRDDVAGKGVRAEWNPGKRGVARRRRHPHTPRRLSRRPRCSAPPGAIHGDRRGREGSVVSGSRVPRHRRDSPPRRRPPRRPLVPVTHEHLTRTGCLALTIKVCKTHHPPRQSPCAAHGATQAAAIYRRKHDEHRAVWRQQEPGAAGWGRDCVC